MNKCFVCGHNIITKKDERYIGNDTYRHEKCKPGSSNWVQTQGKHSENAKYFKNPVEEKVNKNIKHPQHKNIKAFAGRVRYLIFMHERDCKDPEYQPVIWVMMALAGRLEAKFAEGNLTVNLDGLPIAFEPRKSLTERIEKSI